MTRVTRTSSDVNNSEHMLWYQSQTIQCLLSHGGASNFLPLVSKLVCYALVVSLNHLISNNHKVKLKLKLVLHFHKQNRNFISSGKHFLWVPWQVTVSLLLWVPTPTFSSLRSWELGQSWQGCYTSATVSNYALQRLSVLFCPYALHFQTYKCPKHARWSK